MMLINGESIISAVSLKIREAFKQTVDGQAVYPNIYKESTAQGLEKPCFFLWQIAVPQQKLMKSSYLRHYMINVRYMPKEDDEDVYQHLRSIGDALLEHLNQIDLDLPVRGKDFDYKIEDNVLQFFVTYDVKGSFTDGVTLPQMGTLTVNEI